MGSGMVMFRFLTKALIATGLLTGGIIFGHAPSTAGVTQSSFAPVGAPTSVPYGWVDFCQRYRGECDGAEVPAADVNLTPKAMKEIERVNEWVNANVTPMSDMDHWGVIDQWDYPTDGKGDCEDYALLKRKLLIEEGMPRQALLMTVVKDLNNDGHAVLTVKTNKGEFVLDNMRDDVRPWTQTGYRFVKRQSQTDQNVWVSIGAPTEAPAYVSR
jgi:predicted transglutaminase-like cysteine proteinase